MKKTIFALMALTLVFAVAFVACNKDKDKTEDELKVNHLTQKKGWVLTAATAEPKYELNAGALIDDLFDGFISNCEVDDIIYFKETGSQMLNFGKDGKTYPCDAVQSQKEKSLGNWEFANDNKNLKFYFPAYPQQLEAVILKLDENTLKLSVAIDETTPGTKSILHRGNSKKNYKGIFTLTYSVAK